MTEDHVSNKLKRKDPVVRRFLVVHGVLWVVCFGLAMAYPDLLPRWVILAIVVTFVGGVSFLLGIRGSVTAMQKQNFLARLAFVSLFGLATLLVFTFLAGQVWDMDFARTYSPWVIAFSIIDGVQIVGWYDGRKGSRGE